MSCADAIVDTKSPPNSAANLKAGRPSEVNAKGECMNILQSSHFAKCIIKLQTDIFRNRSCDNADTERESPFAVLNGEPLVITRQEESLISGSCKHRAAVAEFRPAIHRLIIIT